MAAAYLAAFAAIAVGLALLIHTAVRLENFPAEILDSPDWRDGYLQLVFGTMLVSYGGLFGWITRTFEANSHLPSAWEQRMEQDLEVARLKVLFSRVRKA
jgi:hypothetical protein